MATNQTPTYRLSRNTPNTNEVWYVSHLPGQGGKDWGYTTKHADSILVTEYWKNRFLSDMRKVGAKGVSAWSTRPAK